MRTICTALAVLLLAGCAGQVTYTPPTSSVAAGSNIVTIAKARDDVWAGAVPELGKRFFVINNLDKASGLINLSYSGDPEKYVDCGRITSYVKNARGERTYNFAGSSAAQNYEVMPNGQNLFAVERRMALEGRINLIFEEAGPGQTRVTANTRYVVSRTLVYRSYAPNQIPQTMNDSVTFNTGTTASFPGSQAQTTTCTSTGALERELLSALR